MKAQVDKATVDKLIRDIWADFARQPPARPELAAVTEAIGLGGFSMAVKQRDILRRWAEDVTLSQDLRNYIKQQLATLPI